MTKMKKLLIWTLCVAMLLPAFASFASAKAVPDENFEEMTTTDLKEPDWVGINNNSTSGGAVIDVAPTAKKVVEPAQDIEKTKALGSNSGGTVDSGVLTITEDLPAVTAQISFDLYAESCTKNGFYLEFGNKTGSTSTSSFILDVQFPSHASGSNYKALGNSLVLSYGGGSGNAVFPSFHGAYPPVLNTEMKNGAYMKLGEWHNIKVVLTEGASTAALYIDG